MEKVLKQLLWAVVDSPGSVEKKKNKHGCGMWHRVSGAR